MTEPSNVPRRPGVDAAPADYGNFQVGDFIDSMLITQRHEPHPVEMRVGSWFFDEVWRAFEREGIDEPLDALPDPTERSELQEDVSIFLVVTDVRVIWPDVREEDCLEPYYQAPEYEVEGWLLNPPGNPEAKAWVRCRLRTTDTAALEECTVYLLNPCEERGTEPTPGIV